MWNKALFVSYVCHFRRGEEEEVERKSILALDFCVFMLQ